MRLPVYLASLLAALFISQAAAQDWPSRPVTLVNPFAVASAVDVVALQDPEVHAKLADIGATVVASSPAAAAAFHRKELEKFKRAVQLSGASAD